MRVTLILSAVLVATVASAQTTVGDRRAPDAYPTVATAPDEAGPLDGASPDETLQRLADDRLAALMTVLAPRGCRVAEREMREVLAPEGFSFDFVSRTITELYVNGVAAIDAQGYVAFPAEICPPATPVASPRARVVSAFRLGNCTLSERDLRAATPDLSEEDRLSIVGPWLDAGLLVPGRQLTATLDATVCQGR